MLANLWRQSTDSTSERRPGIVIIINENPNWPELDKAYADETSNLLVDGLDEQGYTYRAYKYFDDLSFLNAYDPREWLIWNWGEEWAGKIWSEAEVIEQLENRGFAYTGTAAEPIRITQDRMRVKQVLRAAGLPTLPAQVFTNPANAAKWEFYPAIVKGNNQHASIGIDGDSVVHTREQLEARVRFLHEHYNDSALVEPFLDTREFQVAVWGNDDPEALPPCEIDFSIFSELRDRLHTQAWKTDRESRGYKEIRMRCPAPLDRPDWRERIQRIAVQAYRAVGLRDYARFDMRMLGDEPQILDVNTNPELDPESVVLAGARAVGMNYGQMADRIIQFAAVRMPR